MTVAAGIEIGVGGRSQPAQSSFPAQGSFRVRPAPNTSEPASTGAGAANPSTTAPPGAESFRSNWQAQLASLAGGSDSPAAEQETLDDTPEAAPKEAAASGMPFTQARTADLSLPLMSGATQKAGLSPAGIAAPSGGMQARVPAARAGIQTPQPGLAQLTAAASRNARPQRPASAAAEDALQSKDSKTVSAAKPLKRVEAAALSPSFAMPMTFIPVGNIAQTPTPPSQAAVSSPRPTAFSAEAVSDSLSNSYTLAVRNPLLHSQGTQALPAAQKSDVRFGNPVPQGAAAEWSGAAGNQNGSMAHAPALHSFNSDGRATVDGSSAATGAILRQGFEPAASPAVHSPASGQTSLSPTSVRPSVTAPSGPNQSALPGSGAVTAGESAPPSGQRLTQVEPQIQGIAQGPHQAMERVDQAHAQSGSAELQAPSAPVSGEGINRVPVASDPAALSSAPVPMPAQTPADPAVTNVNSSSVQGIKRTTRGADAPVSRTTPVQAQSAAVSGDATSIARDPAGVQTTANPAAGNASAATEPPMRETFAALDAEPAPGALAWTHASARQAEAGFEDPALGWVGVRADMSGGAVHATLVPSSVEAAQALGLHMDGLNAYMAAQHTPVESLAMAAPEGRDASHNAEQSLNQGMNQGPNQGTGQGTEQGANQGAGQHTEQPAWTEPESSSTPGGRGVDSRMPAGTSVLPVGQAAAAQVQSSRGVHISVVA
jgi:hypothetical protein